MPQIRHANIRLECPSLDSCERAGEWPVFFAEAVKPFSNHNQVAIHVVFDVSAPMREYFEAFVLKLSQTVSASFVGKTASSWDGLPESGSLDAFLAVGFNYRGSHQDAVPDISKLEGSWKVIATPKPSG